MIVLIAAALILAAPQEGKPPGGTPPEAPPARPAAEPQNGIVVDGIAAFVYGEVITESEVQRRIAPAVEALGFVSPEREVRVKELRLRELRNMVLDRIFKHAAREAKASVPDKEVEKRLKERVKEVGSVPKMLRLLSNEGMTLGQLEEEIKDTVRYQRFMSGRLFGSEEIPQIYDTEVTPEELRACYRENLERFREPEEARVRCLLLSREGRSVEEARELARRLAEEVRAGADMAALAREHNPGGLGEKEGDLGWIRRDSSYQQVLRDFAFSQPEGAVSGPLEAADGFLVVRVEGRRPERLLGFEEAQKRIRDELTDRKFQKIFNELKEELLREAYIWPPDLFQGRGR